MLVLTRRTGESLILYTSDGPIEVRLCQVSGRDRAKIGVLAPKNVQISRDELLSTAELQEVRYGPGKSHA